MQFLINLCPSVKGVGGCSVRKTYKTHQMQTAGTSLSKDYFFSRHSPSAVCVLLICKGTVFVIIIMHLGLRKATVNQNIPELFFFFSYRVKIMNATSSISAVLCQRWRKVWLYERD